MPGVLRDAMNAAAGPGQPGADGSTAGARMDIGFAVFGH